MKKLSSAANVEDQRLLSMARIGKCGKCAKCIQVSAGRPIVCFFVLPGA